MVREFFKTKTKVACFRFEIIKLLLGVNFFVKLDFLGGPERSVGALLS